MLSKGAFQALQKTLLHGSTARRAAAGRGAAFCVIAHGRSTRQRREERHPRGGGTRPARADEKI